MFQRRMFRKARGHILVVEPRLMAQYTVFPCSRPYSRPSTCRNLNCRPKAADQKRLTFENHVVREGLVGAATGGIRRGTLRANSRKETSRTFKVLRVNVPSLSSILNSTDVPVRFCPVENNITQPHYHPHLGPGPASNKEVVGHPIIASPQSRWL